MSALPFRVTYGRFGRHEACFSDFAQALQFARKQRAWSDTQIINDDRADGGKMQGLTPEQYQEWIDGEPEPTKPDAA